MGSLFADCAVSTSSVVHPSEQANRFMGTWCIKALERSELFVDWSRRLM
ncbi:hypothetical protein SynPROS91_02667 [Synechococcus sp. PROS-9-1]|nr:hypothetical protein SynPROS91_02667 [Synechococcus sp. PROS-9-1]